METIFNTLAEYSGELFLLGLLLVFVATLCGCVYHAIQEVRRPENKKK